MYKASQAFLRGYFFFFCNLDSTLLLDLWPYGLLAKFDDVIDAN